VTPFEHAAAIIAEADNLLVTAHRGPDGDAVGSMVALAGLLRSRGKKATLYCPDPIPRNLKWLPSIKSFVRRLKRDARYQATVVVDCGDRKLLGRSFPGANVTGTLIAFDHHASSRPFGDVFVNDPSAASVGVLIARLARHLGWPLTDGVAKGVFVSLVSDTGSFRYSNANAEAFRLAAELVDSGIVDPWDINERLHERVPLSRYRLLAAALTSIELTAAGKLAFMTITEDTLKSAEASWEDSEGIVNYARAIAGVEAGVLLTPAKGGGIRVSVRSKGHVIDAGAVCSGLGGGGHPGAGGCVLKGDLQHVRLTIETELTAALGGGEPDQTADTES
jgi:bifunctional oligoribonuclease and PAP phosphatase NrnA